MKCDVCSRVNLKEALRCVECGNAFADLSKVGEKDIPKIRVILPQQVQPTSKGKRPRGSSRWSPRVVAVSLVVGIVGVGLLLGASSRKSGSETIGPRPATTIEASAEQMVDGTQIVSGVDVKRSVVQVAVAQEGEICASGSGTVVIDSNFVLTSLHVVEEDQFCRVDQLFVETIMQIDQPPVRTYNARVIATDKKSDLAILEISPITNQAPRLTPVKVTDEVQLGDSLTAIGFPAIGGSTVTVTKGEVAGFSNYQGVRWIKSSVSISSGNSGGGAFNLKGELIGVPSFLGSADSEETTDCRPIDDTNGDGSLDSEDLCVSMGGFINSLSPYESVNRLIASVGR
jgi:S1-C subfamily serine protease